MRFWTREEWEKVEAYRKEGWRDENIARKIGRSVFAIRRRSVRHNREVGSVYAPPPPPWKRLEDALAWQHGPERASRILAGQDPDTNTDIERWRRLGQ